MSALPTLKSKPRRGNAFRASHQVSENSEWFKKLDHSAQFQWEQISSAVQPCRSLRRSEAESTTSSRYSSFWGREKSLDPGRLFDTRVQTVFRLSAHVDILAFGSDLRRGKVRLAFRLHTAFPVKNRPKYASLSFHAPTPVERTFDADLSTDNRPSAFPVQSGKGSLKLQPMYLRQRKYRQSVKDQGEDVPGARLHPAL